MKTTNVAEQSGRDPLGDHCVQVSLKPAQRCRRISDSWEMQTDASQSWRELISSLASLANK